MKMGTLSFSLKSLTFILLVALLVWSSTLQPCNARRGGSRHWRQSRAASVSLSKKEKSHGGNQHHSRNSPNSPPQIGHTGPKTEAPPSLPGQGDKDKGGGHSTIFDVMGFGAKGDGSTDDTKAFEAAWAAACQVEDSTIVVPSEHVFLVGPISFSGPNCQSNIVFQLDGKIIAPTSSKAWGSGLLQWLEFSKLRGITVKGGGVIDGQGSVWWKDSPFDDPIDDETQLLVPIENNSMDDSLDIPPVSSELNEKMPSTKPTALRFYGSYNVTVTGITIQNSPQCHLKFDNCIGVQVFNMSISSPGDSLNTDGIHLQNSKDVLIRSTNLACGKCHANEKLAVFFKSPI